MTYETGTANDLVDLLDKLDTFAQVTHGGWSSIYSPNPDTTNRWFELKKGSLSFGIKWPASPATGNHISVHQATGSTSSASAPGAHTADSGNGFNTTSGGSSADFLTERCVSQIGNGPFPSYHFFADDAGPGDYIHVVVEIVSGTFRHFGFGSLAKFGNNWTGGEYVYGHHQDQTAGTPSTDGDTNLLLDGLSTTSGAGVLRAATVRIASGLPNQGAAVWGVSKALASASLGTDTAGNVRRQIHGGYRTGLSAAGFGNIIGSGSMGLVGMHAIAAYYRDPSNARVYLLGHVKDVRACNVRNFEPGQELTVGSDTWVFFPQSIRSIASVANASQFSGVAYRKVV